MFAEHASLVDRGKQNAREISRVVEIVERPESFVAIQMAKERNPNGESHSIV